MAMPPCGTFVYEAIVPERPPGSIGFECLALTTEPVPVEGSKIMRPAWSGSSRCSPSPTRGDAGRRGDPALRDARLDHPDRPNPGAGDGPEGVLPRGSDAGAAAEAR